MIYLGNTLLTPLGGGSYYEYNPGSPTYKVFTNELKDNYTIPFIKNASGTLWLTYSSPTNPVSVNFSDINLKFDGISFKFSQYLLTLPSLYSNNSTYQSLYGDITFTTGDFNGYIIMDLCLLGNYYAKGDLYKADAVSLTDQITNTLILLPNTTYTMNVGGSHHGSWYYLSGSIYSTCLYV